MNIQALNPNIPWNKSKLCGRKAPLKPREIWETEYLLRLIYRPSFRVPVCQIRIRLGVIYWGTVRISSDDRGEPSGGPLVRQPMLASGLVLLPG